MRKKIGELLVEAGVCTPDDVRVALGNQKTWGAGQRLGKVLVSMGCVTPAQIAKALSLQYDVPFIELPQIPASVSSLVPIDFQAANRIVPFRVETDGRVDRLHVAVEDPSDLEQVDELRFQLGKPIRVFVAASDDIEQVLAALRGDVIAEIDPVEIDEDTSELVIEPQPPQQAPQGWIATAPAAAAPPPTPPAGPTPLPPEWEVLDGAAGAPRTKAAEVVKFPPPQKPAPPPAPPPAAAATAPPSPAPQPQQAVPIEFTEEDLKILENIERMAGGEEPNIESARIKPAQMVASLVRLLMRKGVIGEAEFLEELGRK